MSDIEQMVKRAVYDGLCVATYGTVADVQVQIANNVARAVVEASGIEQLEAQNRRYAEALRPFAEHPDFHAPDDWPVTFIDEDERTPGVTAGDFRRARAALAHTVEIKPDA